MVPVASSSSSTTTCWSTCSPTLVSPQPQTHVELGREAKGEREHTLSGCHACERLFGHHTPRRLVKLSLYSWLEMFKSPQRTFQHLPYVVGLLQIWFWGCRRQIFALISRHCWHNRLCLRYIQDKWATNLTSPWCLLHVSFWIRYVSYPSVIAYFRYFSRFRFI